MASSSKEQLEQYIEQRATQGWPHSFLKQVTQTHWQHQSLNCAFQILPQTAVSRLQSLYSSLQLEEYLLGHLKTKVEW